jgi:hypothetical protein
VLEETSTLLDPAALARKLLIMLWQLVTPATTSLTLRPAWR